MRIWIAGAIAAFLLAGAANAAAPDFGGLDRDKSGSLEEKEIAAAAPEVLKKYDKDGNGSLDRAEFEAAGGTRSRFEFLDKDNSSKVDIDEFRSAAIERFKQVDTDRNGRIDVQDWSKLRQPIQNPILFFYF
ncbi:MAG: EF-hand domain-containing protein [Syntrophales bacterium]